ncbi:GNAT family N-acetyltransferase [Bdellovibrio sp. GT3]|uniref:GNAT family N-acetyltransferase n=1 Tax=Bdellovibrio sp. GT3 TaxID=3136282 RepID=UPI0030F112C6
MDIKTEITKSKTGKTITLRAPTIEDAKALRVFMVEVAETAPYILSTADDFRSKSEDSEQNWIKRYQESNRDMIILAECDGKIVGNLDFSTGIRFKNLHRGHLGMSIAPSLRGDGIGELLLRKLFAEVPRAEGITQIELSVMHPNTPAYNLYKKVGFMECGRKPNAFRLEDGTFAEEISMYVTV